MTNFSSETAKTIKATDHCDRLLNFAVAKKTG